MTSKQWLDETLADPRFESGQSELNIASVCHTLIMALQEAYQRIEKLEADNKSLTLQIESLREIVVNLSKDAADFE